jgi:molybdopterin-containing oxidoreductase family membrane subunit
MARSIYREIDGGFGFWTALSLLGLLLAIGLGSAWVMEHHGHVVTGMTNRVVWGTPHVFAVFLIVAASGVLNIASVGSVFGYEDYKPLSRLSGLLAITLLVAGLAILVLDLGRPERLIVAMTHFNLRSIFAWNIYLYTGFLAVVALYLFTHMVRGMGRFVKAAGIAAFLWRLVLTTGTGSIFGWLVARQAYSAAIMAPLFIAMSLSFGLATFILVLTRLYTMSEGEHGPALLRRLGRLLGIFAAAVLYFTAVQHLANLYAPERQAATLFVLANGGIYTALFWGAQVLLGGVVPIALVLRKAPSYLAIPSAAALIVFGGLAQVYVIIVGAQAYPLVLIPGLEAASALDGQVADYAPSLLEIGLGMGGVALALGATLIALKVLRFLPERLGADLQLRAKAITA